eukprot:m51a1_g10604 hypothetical protein (78) ;mRNA; r:38459-38692
MADAKDTQAEPQVEPVESEFEAEPDESGSEAETDDSGPTIYVFDPSGKVKSRKDETIVRHVDGGDLVFNVCRLTFTD